MPGKIDYIVTKHIATLSENKSGNYTLELNMVSYNGAPPKLDLRKWNRTTGKILKGLTLTDEEAEALKKALNEIA